MSNIEWTNKTWNPIIGCSHISPGCDNCYAEKMSCRLACMQGQVDNYGHVVKWRHNEDDQHDVKPKSWNGKTHFAESQLNKPLKRKKPTMYFVCSMGDLFHESVPFEWITKVFNVMAFSPQHTFQILTKRVDRMKKYFESNHFQNQEVRLLEVDGKDIKWPLENVWIGATVENQSQAYKRVPTLLEIPAKLRFLSCEPLLSQLFIKQYLKPSYSCSKCQSFVGYVDEYKGERTCGECESEAIYNHDKIDWVICGGETGSKARPLHPDWVRSLRKQCEVTNTPFFFKQWGEWGAYKYGGAHNVSGDKEFNWCERGLPFQWMCKVGKNKAGYLLDGIEHREMPNQV